MDFTQLLDMYENRQGNNNNNVTVQNVFHVRNNIKCSKNCKYRTAATQYIIDTCLVSMIYNCKGDNNNNNNNNNNNGAGTAVAQWLRYCGTNWKVAGSIPACVNGFFIDIKSFRSHYGSGVDSASNRNEYREHFLGVKSGRCVRLTTLPPSCAVVTKSGNPKFLEPSGRVQAFNGTDVPLIRMMGW
jgi:hypothetical protein